MSDVNDNERLVVLLEARIRDFERNMQKASGTAGREFGKMRKDGASATRAMEQDAVRASRRIDQAMASVSTQFGTLGKAASLAGKTVAGALAIGGLEAIVGQFRATATGVATIGNEARRAGLSLKAFQELSFVAEQNRISIDALVDGMKELSLRADEYIVTGAGSAAEAFKRLGFTAEDLKGRLKDPSALLVEIIRRMEELGDTAASIRIADELFGGTGGEQFVELLNRGSRGIKQMISDANEFGLVLDDKMIAKADEIDRKFNLVARTVGTSLKEAILGATDALAGFIDQFNEIEQQQTNTLKLRLNDNFAEQQKIQSAIAGLEKRRGGMFGMFDGTYDRQIEEYQKKLADLRGEFQRIRDITDRRSGWNDGSAKPGAQPAAAPASGPRTFTPISTNSGDVLLGRLAAGKSREHVDGLASDLREALSKALANAPESVRNATTLNSGYRSFERQAQLWTEALKKYGSPEAARKWVAPPGKSQHQDGQAADLGFQTAEARQWFHKNAGTFGLTFPMKHEPWHVETVGARRKTNDDAFREKWEASEEQAQAYDRIIADAGRFVIAQETERQAMAQTGEAAAKLRYEHELLAEMEAAGLPVTKDRAQAISELAQRMAEADVAAQQFAESQEAARAAAEDMQFTASDAFKGFVSDLRNGVSAADALQNALGRIVDKMLDATIDNVFASLFSAGGAGGGGLLGGIGKAFGSLFGGARAKGGAVDGSKFYLVGEKGPELFAPGRSGTVIPNDRMPAPANRMEEMPAAAPVSHRTQNITIGGPHIQIDGSADQRTVGAMRRVIEENNARMKRDLDKNIGKSVGSWESLKG